MMSDRLNAGHPLGDTLNVYMRTPPDFLGTGSLEQGLDLGELWIVFRIGAEDRH